LAFIDIDQFLDSTYKLGDELETFTYKYWVEQEKCIKDLEDKGITSFSETK
jgi:hypothetical protein